MNRISSLLVLLLVFGAAAAAAGEVGLLKDGRPLAAIVVDVRGAAGEGPAILKDAGDWLAQSLQAASGAKFEMRESPGNEPAVVIARADAWPQIAAEVKFPTEGFSAYAIVTRPNRIFVLGASEAAARHGVAGLLQRCGFRMFAPSPRWHITPKLKDLAVDLNLVESPALIDRRIWYAYGMSGDDL